MAAPPTGHPASLGRGVPGAQPVEPAWRGPRQRKGGREVAGPDLLLDARAPPLPARQPTGAAWSATFRTLWVETERLPGLWRTPGHLRGSLGPVLFVTFCPVT